MMHHYTIREAEQHVSNCIVYKVIPLDEHEWFKALVDQANSAFECERRTERAEAALGRMIAEGVK